MGIFFYSSYGSYDESYLPYRTSLADSITLHASGNPVCSLSPLSYSGLTKSSKPYQVECFTPGRGSGCPSGLTWSTNASGASFGGQYGTPSEPLNNLSFGATPVSGSLVSVSGSGFSCSSTLSYNDLDCDVFGPTELQAGSSANYTASCFNKINGVRQPGEVQCPSVSWLTDRGSLSGQNPSVAMVRPGIGLSASISGKGFVNASSVEGNLACSLAVNVTLPGSFLQASCPFGVLGGKANVSVAQSISGLPTCSPSVSLQVKKQSVPTGSSTIQETTLADVTGSCDNGLFQFVVSVSSSAGDDARYTVNYTLTAVSEAGAVDSCVIPVSSAPTKAPDSNVLIVLAVAICAAVAMARRKGF